MKKNLFYILAGCLLLVFSSCYKDKGSYNYHDIGDPVLSNFDSVYTAIVGDSLIITPKVTLPGGRTDYSLSWEIDDPGNATGYNYDGNSLRIVFNLGAQRYKCQLTVSDNKLGMKYFFAFFILGQTQFTSGMLVLSDQAGTGKLSFITPKDSVVSNVYESINNQSLGQHPTQLVEMRNINYLNVTNFYWIVCNDPKNPGVRLDPTTLQQDRTLEGNFFDAPSPLDSTYLLKMENGTATAIINGEMYLGTTSTAPFSTVYGNWGTSVAQGTNLAPDLITSNVPHASGIWYLGFDTRRKCLQRFTGVGYSDTTFIQKGGFFNAANLKMDLIKLVNVDDNNIYLFADSAGVKYELKMGVDFLMGGTTITQYSKKVFPGASLLKTDTKWAASSTNIIFFSSGSKVYRYNPLNAEVRPLTADFGGQDVTMVKISPDYNQLYVGVDGTVYTLDISVGQNGNILKKVAGLPGKVVDIFLRNS